MKHIAFALLLFLGTNRCIYAQEQLDTYTVVGIADGDSLNVRSLPGEKHPIIMKLRNGAAGIQIIGPRVMNGDDDWIPIMISGVKGWVRPMYLSRSNKQSLSPLKMTTVPDDSTRFAAARPKPQARETSSPAASGSSSGFGWFILGVFALFVFGAAKKQRKRQLRPNQCPKCEHDTLETRQKFFGGSYRRCTRFFCDYNEDRLKKAQTPARPQERYSSADDARSTIIQWQAENSIAQARGEPLPHPGAPR